MCIEGTSLSKGLGMKTNQKITLLNYWMSKPMLSTGRRFKDGNIRTLHLEGVKEYIHLCMITYTYIYIHIQRKMGMRNHSRYEHYLIIGQLVNGRSREIQDQTFLLRRQTKEEWILLTKTLFTLLYFD